jgi:hypothetical protein
MANRVSNGSLAPLSTKKEEFRKGADANRFSFPFNATQVVAIGASVLLVFLPIAIAAKAQPLSQAQVQICNATCAPLLLAPLTIAAYLKRGIIEGLSSQAAFKAEQLTLENVGQPWEPDLFKQRQLEEKKIQLLQEASEEYVQKAPDHPVARAIALHQAKEALIQASKVRGTSLLDNQIEALRLKAAQACLEAASLAEAPDEKLDWTAQGLRDLEISLNPSRDWACLHSGNLPKCDAALSLWSAAAEAFLRLSPRKSHHFDIVYRVESSAIFSGTQAAAVQCLRNAAYCAKMLRHHQEAENFYEKAIEVMKNIDTTPYSLKMRVALQEEIVSTSITLLNMAHILATPPQPQVVASRSARAFSETMVVQEQYQQLLSESPSYMAPYYTIKRALRLEDAAFLTSNLTQSAELLKQARDSVQKAWDQNRDDCLDIPDFTLNYQWRRHPFSLERSLLGRLQRETQETERKLWQQNLKPLEQVLTDAWNRFRQWMR